jgi:hypothetical protein
MRNILMRYNYLYAKHQKSSSPPFRKSKRGLDDWVRSLRYVKQHPYDLSDIESLRQSAVPKIEFLDHGSNDRYLSNGASSGQESRKN